MTATAGKTKRRRRRGNSLRAAVADLKFFCGHKRLFSLPRSFYFPIKSQKITNYVKHVYNKEKKKINQIIARRTAKPQGRFETNGISMCCLLRRLQDANTTDGLQGSIYVSLTHESVRQLSEQLEKINRWQNKLWRNMYKCVFQGAFGLLF